MNHTRDNGNAFLDLPANGITLHRRAELWRALCSHLIGLATVFWWIAFKEPPPK